MSKRDQSSETFFKSTEVIKVDTKENVVVGWGLICTVDGKPYFDLGEVNPKTKKRRRDHIPVAAMFKAALDFMRHSRVSKEMHAGDQAGTVLFAMPITDEILKAAEMTSRKTGLLVGVHYPPAIIRKFESGEYTGFSIGGKRRKDKLVLLEAEATDAAA